MSSYYIPKRKKIRGWKRRIREIDRWGEWLQKPSIDWWEKSGVDYQRCTLYPFYMAEKRHPPLWFYKLIIAKFIQAYHAWDKVYKELGKPYDLLIWVYDPAFIRSEIVCYKVDSEGQRINFAWESELSKPFPFEKFRSKDYDLKSFDWILADEENIHFESELKDADFTGGDLLRDGWVKKAQNSDQVYYAQRIGDFWMGRLKH
jgi:hypothetical protein